MLRMLHKTHSTPLQRGAAMVEFVVMAPLITALGLAVLQYSMMFFAKGQINHATFMAARAGSVSHASTASIEAAYKRALIPLYGGGQNTADLVVAAAKVEADMTSDTFRVEILNPTTQSFDDYADPSLAAQYEGNRAIPNIGVGLKTDLDSIKANSGQTLQDANLLKLRVTHGYEPKVLLMGLIYTKYLQWLDTGEDAFATQLINSGRIPVVSHVTLEMHSDPVEQKNDAGSSIFASNRGLGNNGKPVNPGGLVGTTNPEPECLTIACTVPPYTNGGGGGTGGESGGGGTSCTGTNCPVCTGSGTT